jgi:prepilin-type N-terminal cleavage/methylation domain-containing protein
MKLASVNLHSKHCRRAFTLVELMVAAGIGVILAGTVVLLLVQAATEQQRGYSDTTVEESAYTLQANLTSCLRGTSAGFGMTASYSNTFLSGTNVIGYTTIYVWQPNVDASVYTVGKISADVNNGLVTYTPNITIPANQTIWMTNRSGVVLRTLYFSSSQNLDGSQNNSLVNVTFQMDDNGYSQQNATNNIANIQRSFSVQMRCD